MTSNRLILKNHNKNLDWVMNLVFMSLIFTPMSSQADAPETACTDYLEVKAEKSNHLFEDQAINCSLVLFSDGDFNVEDRKDILCEVVVSLEEHQEKSSDEIPNLAFFTEFISTFDYSPDFETACRQKQ